MPDTLALVEKGEHRLGFYNPATGECEGMLPLPDFPHEMVLDPDGRTAYLGHYGARNAQDPAPGGSAVFVVDLLTRVHLHTIPLPHWHRIHGVACDGLGRLYALAEAEDVLLVMENPKTAEAPDRILPTGGKKGHLLVVTKDGGTVFTSNLASHTISHIDIENSNVPPRQISPGLKPEGLCFSVDESSLFVLTRGDAGLQEISCINGTVLRRIALRGDCSRVYRHGAKRLLVSNYGDQCICLLDRETLQEVAHVPLCGHPTAACIHPEKPEAYVALEHGELQVVDLETFREVRRFSTGHEPDVSILLPG
jgi:DNA-binding beta-propeller fold protein YncE